MSERIIAIVQARMASLRLPGKVLMPMMDKTVLEQVVRRTGCVPAIFRTVVAASDNKLDDLIETLCGEKGIRCFRGSESNVLERFYLCAKEYNAAVIVRVTADDPLKDPGVIKKAVKLYEEGSYDYVSNTVEPTYPEGLDIEVFSFEALERAYHEASLPSEKEHVTPYIYKNPDQFRIYNFKNDIDLSELRLTLDTPEDYALIHKIYEELYKKPNELFGMEEILNLLEQRPNLKDINRGHIRNEGYLKSLKEDQNTGLSRRICGNELKYVKDVLDTEFRSSKGAMMMQRLEKAFAEKVGTKYAIALVNGTSTLHAILEAAGITAGDEVIVPPLTMSSTALAVLQTNATPVFADVEPDTFELSPYSVKSRITSHTKAIITVSLYGLSPDMDAIIDVANQYHLFLVEDNAECLLGTYKGRKVGTIGHAASYSFQSSKHITSGEGGMVVTDSLDFAEAVRRVSSLGYAGVGASMAKITRQAIQNPDYSRHVSMGWNYRMPELCAAVALGQLENCDALIKRRIEAASLYAQAVEGTDWLKPQYVGNEYECTYWTYAVKLDHPGITWKEFRDQYMAFGGDGIYAAWKLTYLEPMMTELNLLNREKFISNKNRRSYRRGLCPVAEELQGKLLQFKTNYWNREDAVRQAEILRRTIAFFNDRSVES